MTNKSTEVTVISITRDFHIRTKMPNAKYGIFELNRFKIKVILFYDLFLIHSEIIVFKIKN